MLHDGGAVEVHDEANVPSNRPVKKTPESKTRAKREG
jgi:hypothetical protein